MLASKADAPGRCLGQRDHGETMGKREGNYGKLLILVGNNLRAAEWCLFLEWPVVFVLAYLLQSSSSIQTPWWPWWKYPSDQSEGGRPNLAWHASNSVSAGHLHPSWCCHLRVGLDILSLFSAKEAPERDNWDAHKWHVSPSSLSSEPLYCWPSMVPSQRDPWVFSGCPTALGSHLGDWRFPRKMCFSETTAKKMPLVKRTKTVVELFTYIEYIYIDHI